MSNLPYPVTPTAHYTPVPNNEYSGGINQNDGTNVPGGPSPQIGFTFPGNDNQGINTTPQNYNPPKPSYYPPPNQSKPVYGMTTEDVQALVTVGTTIGINGRHSVTTTCPHCKMLIRTQIVKEKNTEADSSVNMRYLIIGCFLVVICTGAFGFAAFKSGKPIILLGALGFDVLVIALICCAKCFNDGCKFFADVTHLCPNCKAKLGTSSGTDALAQDDRRRRHHY